MTRDPLTERYLRETREIDPDPKGWIEGPHHHHVDPWHRYVPWMGPALMLASAVAAVGVLVLLAWLLFA